uniref:CSON013290 protein n=1 Tax=Culicoides sonorensis TaxID=179676 RepID=A0A336M8E7_CULSO
MDKNYQHEKFYCRLCLEKISPNTKFIDITSENGEIYDKIIKIFHFTFDTNNLSPFVCIDCRDQVEIISQFIEKVVSNQEKLRVLNFLNEDHDEKYDPKQIKYENEEMEVEFLDENDYEDNIKEICEINIVEPQTKVKNEQEASFDFVCDFCSKKFCSKSTLTFHMKRHMSDIKPKHVACKYCEKTFKSESGLKNHIGQIHENKPKLYDSETAVDISKYLLCELCSGRPMFPSFNDMNDHYQENHGIRGYVRCCSKRFYTRRSVVYHSDVHSRPVDYICKICQRLLPNKYALRDHMTRHKPEEEKKFQCKTCPKRFHIEYDLTIHIRNVHEKNPQEEKAHCDTCDKEFASKISLYLHNRRFHMNLEYPICEACGKQCRSKADLRSHIKSKHTFTPKTKCDICGNSVKNIKKHLQIHRESELNIKCEICGHETTTFKYLKLHMKIHNDEKPYVCPTCDQAFKRKKALDDHMSLHNGIPRHFCNYCDRAFNNSGNKFKHIKQAHPEEASKNRRKSIKIKTAEAMQSKSIESGDNYKLLNEMNSDTIVLKPESLGIVISVQGE